METKDVERLVTAHETVVDALNRNRPRQAARILCQEFRILVEEGSFWDDAREAAVRLQNQRGQGTELLRSIGRLLDAEARIFGQLGIDSSRTDKVLGYVYGGLDILRTQLTEPTPAALANLRDRLDEATNLVCDETKGPIRRAFEWTVSWKGARVLAGAAIGGGNIASALTTDLGAVSWASLAIGVSVMKGDVDGIIDAFRSEK